MAEIQSNIYTVNPAPSFKGDNGLIIEAHNSHQMKLERPKVSAADFSQSFNLSNNNKYSMKEADTKIKNISNDIYQGAVKEKQNHEFSFKRYFTIFGILALLTAAIGYFRKGK